MRPPFSDYWIVDGVKVNSFDMMRRLVLKGAMAIEVSAEQQEAAFNERRRKARENAALDEKIRQAAAQRAHEQSIAGKQEQARRTAAEHPGGLVSGVSSPFEELDQFSPARTNELR